MPRRCVTLLCLLATVPAAGCGEAGDVDLRTREQPEVQTQSTTEAPPQQTAREARRVRARIAAARKAGFERGVDYVLHGLSVTPGQDYAIAFKQGRRGFFVKDHLPMRPGLAYECPPQTPYCNATPTDTEVPAATSEPAAADPCHPDYPNVCLDPNAADYDCAGSGDDGPDYVSGRVVITGSDPFDLDGYPRDGVGCERR